MMIGGRRACGKSTELIKEASQNNLYIICASRERVQHIFELANKLKLHIPFPISVDELPLRSQFIGKVIVDDIEDVLTYFIRKPIHKASTSMELRNL